MQIHPADLPDIDSIMKLLARQFHEHEIEVQAVQLRAAVEAMLADVGLGFFLLVTEVDNAIGLACVSFCWTLEHGGKSAWLDELYVLPEFRGRGVGSALLDATLRAARNQGCAAVDLEVDAGHSRAEALYQRYGFEPLPRSRWVKNLTNQRIDDE